MKEKTFITMCDFKRSEKGMKFNMEIISKQDIDKYNREDYVWYACYGSNINYERFMYYINGDKKGKYSTINGCEDKSEPIEI